MFSGIVMDIKFEQPWNAAFPILVVFVPMVIFVKVIIAANAFDGMKPEIVIEAGNPVNAYCPMEVIDDDCISIVFNNEQLLNADAPIDWTLAGILIYVNFEQFWNADRPIDWTLEGILIYVNFEQFWKADIPITVILDDIAIDVKFEQPWNEYSFILVIILLFILTDVIPEQFLNAEFPILVVFVPMVIFCKVVIPENTFDGIDPDSVIDGGNPVNIAVPMEIIDEDWIVITFNDEQFWNTWSPILVTLFGIVIEVNPLQFANEYEFRFLTFEPRLNDLIL